MPEASPAYRPRLEGRVRQLVLRDHVHCQVREWGAPEPATSTRPPLVLCHGWMDVGASFQFMVDCLSQDRHILALDWRGFGGSTAPACDSYWFPDYLGDLDALLAARFPDTPVDLLGHSMGGNIAMSYAGVRPERIRRLINLEGFGMPDVGADQAPARLTRWLDELKAPQSLRSYAGPAEVAERLCKNNPRLMPDKAAWLAHHWAAPGADGRWHILGDAAHKRVNPIPYRRDEALACWRAIQAPVLWVEGAQTAVLQGWGERYPRSEFETRLAVVPKLTRRQLDDCGHMLHFDQPEALARTVEDFLEH